SMNRLNCGDVECPAPSAMFAGMLATARRSCEVSSGYRRCTTPSVALYTRSVSSWAFVHTLNLRNGYMPDRIAPRRSGHGIETLQPVTFQQLLLPATCPLPPAAKCSL